MDKNTTDKISVGNSTMPRAEQGWECPRCGHINAPWVRQCDCPRSIYTITSDLTYKPEQWEDLTYMQTDDITKNCTNPNNCHTPPYTTETYDKEQWKKYLNHNDIPDTIGGSDYWNNNTKTWENIPRIPTKKE